MSLENFYQSFERLDSDIRGIMRDGGDPADSMEQILEIKLMQEIAAHLQASANGRYNFVSQMNGKNVALSDKPSMQRLCHDCREYYPLIAGSQRGAPSEAFIMCPQDGIQTVKRLGRDYQKIGKKQLQ